MLLDGPKGSGTKAFRLAVLESIARRALTTAAGQTGLLLPGPETRPTGERPIDAIREIFDAARARTSRGTGVPVKKLARAARRRYGYLDGYARA